MKITKNMNNVEIAELLRAVAAAYEIKDEGKNKFRIIAYERAADAIEHLSSEAKDLWDDGKLDDVAGIGESINKHLGEIFAKGKSPHINSILSDIPDSVFELLPIEGIGPKTAFRLVGELKIKSPDAVKKLLIKCQKKELEKLEGFGKDSQNAIMKSIKEISGREKRHLINYAEEISHEIISWMKQNRYVIRVDTLGSLRRKASTVGDIDIAAATNEPLKVIEHFVKYPHSGRILEKGEAKASIILPGNIQVDLMVQDEDSYGSLLQHFTGSKHHNIALREYALKKGLSLSEYGIKRLNTKNSHRAGDTSEPEAKLITFKAEEDFYKYLGMDLIPPELREDTGEIGAAVKHKLPTLVELEDIKADLQVHSDFNIETSHDLGESSSREIIAKAIEKGYQYIAFTEHNPGQSGHSEKEVIELIKRKKEMVDKINYSFKQKHQDRVFKVYNSLEIDILPDSELPVTERGLELLDFALVSIHSSFRQERDKITDRVINALSYPKVKIFAHPTARKLNEREGIDLNWVKIFEFCSKNNKWLEINADPMRLDLPDYLVKEAVKYNIYLTLGTDSHHISQMDNMRYGVYVARRGWAQNINVVNTRNLEEFDKMVE